MIEHLESESRTKTQRSHMPRKVDAERAMADGELLSCWHAQVAVRHSRDMSVSEQNHS